MKRNLFVLVMLLAAIRVVHAQDRFYTKAGKIEFFSKAPLEDIQATNRTATVVLDSKSGAIQFSVIMKGFEFEKAMMQQHFNENYVESDKFPKGEFKGTITNNSEINYTKNGSYPAHVKGSLTIHGITHEIDNTGTIKVVDGKPQVSTSLNIKLSDYNIGIPAIVKDKISNSIKINIDCKLEPLK